MDETVATLIVGVVLLIGLVGTIVPVLPGVLLMWAGVVAYGFLVGFDTIGIIIVIVATALSVAAFALGLIVPKRAADESGAAKSSQWAAAIGAVIGFFVIPFVGVVVGALAGIALSEIRNKGSWELARGSTIAVAKGFGVSAIVQFGCGVLILFAWGVWAATVVW